MVRMEIRPGMRPTTKQIARLMGRMKLSQFIALTEDEFREFVRELENDSLFKRLINPRIGAIRHKGFPGTSIATHKTLPLDPAITPSNLSADIGGLLKKEEKTLRIIKRIGTEKFKKYFLGGTEEMTLEKLAEVCELSIEVVKKIIDFTDRAYIQSRFASSLSGVAPPRIYYTTIATIKKKDSGFEIAYFSPDSFKGCYLIDDRKLAKIKEANDLSPREMKRFDALLSRIRLVNSRRSTIYQIIKGIIESQSKYLSSDDPENLVPFTQRQLSERLGIDPSLISRAIFQKAITTPRNEIMSLRDFFPSGRKIRKGLIEEIISQERKEIGQGIIRKARSDEEIRKELKRRYGISISRRAVTECRLDLKIPAAHQRFSVR